MSEPDSEPETIRPEFDFDKEFDHVANILAEMKTVCKENGNSFLFENTTALDFFLFMQYDPEDPVITYLNEEEEEAEKPMDEE